MSEDYRARARALRAEAQQRLRQLRAQRLNARRPETAGAETAIVTETAVAEAVAQRAAPQPETPRSVEPEAPRSAAGPAPAGTASITVLGDVAALARELAATPAPVAVAMAEDGPQPPEAEASGTRSGEAAPSVAAGIVAADDAAAADGGAGDGGAGDGPAGTAALDAPQIAEPAPAPRLVAVETDAAGEDPGLGAVPGVGPGLVWMLAEVGVRTVDDLLGCDPAALSDRLGLIGRLIDVARLQRLAAESRQDAVNA